MATQQEFAAHVGVTQQTVAELAKRGVLPRGGNRAGLNLEECRLRYCAHLREVAAGRLGEGSDELDLVEQRARLAKEQADAQKMKNDLFRGRVVFHADVTQVISAMFLEVRNKYLELPSKLAPQLARLNDPRRVYIVLEEAVRDIMQALVDDAPLAAARRRSQGDPQAGSLLDLDDDATQSPQEGFQTAAPRRRPEG